MTLVDDWKKILKKAHSIRLIALALVFESIQAALPSFTEDIPPHIFGMLSAACLLGAGIARVVAQPELHDGE